MDLELAVRAVMESITLAGAGHLKTGRNLG
jgi:hypothetical protein